VIKPGMFTVNLGSMPINDHVPEMNAAECLKRWGTTSVGIDVMRDRIRVGTPTAWPDGSVTWEKGHQINAFLFLEFVPEHLRALAAAGLEDALAKHRNRRLTPDAVYAFVGSAHESVLRRLITRDAILEFADEWRRIGCCAMRDSGRYTDVQIAAVDDVP
jgi:hypothetical protein